MKLKRIYDRTRFSAEVLKGAAGALLSGLKGSPSGMLYVCVDEGAWTHDIEEEFFSDYRRFSSGEAVFHRELNNHRLWVQCFTASVHVEVGAPSRSRILETFEVFECNLDFSKLPEEPAEPESPHVIFIGHGGSPVWRDLKDHLQDKHELKVEAYEIGARAGHAIRDILQEMLLRTSFALLVMTGEDETTEGGLRARQNVVHEAGLFQGRLGFNRAIVLLEEGTEAFSNIDGIQQIRFARGNIKEAFGEVLATLRREFGGGRA